MRTNVLTILENHYKNVVTLNKATDDDIARQYFMRKKDVPIIREFCKAENVQISFREAGEYTLGWIDKGNPCKGHQIADKSIKMKGGKMTYEIDPKYFDKYKGLVGKADEHGVFEGIWSLSTKPGAAGSNQILALKNVDESIGFCYTGDYDVHDLIKKGNRVVASTPDEHSALETLNNRLLAADPARNAKAKSCPQEKEYETSPVRTTHSPYALVRHGAQTSFMDFMLSAQGKADLRKHLRKPADVYLPAEDKVTKIDEKIVMFDSNGDAYILDSVAKVYTYYKANKLLLQIPFYYFFNELRQTKYDKEIQLFSEKINQLLINTH